MSGASAQVGSVSGCLPGLQHYFGLDEEGGGSYTDFITGATATCTTCPAATASLFGAAQRFSGKNQVDFNEVQNFNWGVYDSFTIEFWMQTSAKPSENMVIIGRSPKDSDFLWWVGVDKDGYMAFELWDKNRKGFNAKYSVKKINDGQWHHIAFVRDDKIKFNKLYVDGFAVVGFEYVYETGFESASPVNIGYLDLNKGHHYSGLLDELKLYDRALQESELREEYNYGAGNYCGPVQIAPDIISQPITFGVTGQTYAYDLKATGNPKPTYTIVSGPEGLSINAATGVLKWVPGTPGKFSVTVQAGNSVGQDQQSFEVDVKQGQGEVLGTVHHWMLNETSGQQYRDYYTPYHATAAAETRPMPVFGIVGGAQRFDGKDDAVNVEESMNFNWEADDNFSIELWMKSTASATDNSVIIGRDSKNSFVHWWIGMDKQGQAGFQLIDAVFEEKYTGNSGPKLNDGKWHQVVAVRNNASNLNSLYVDGERVAEKTYRYTGGFESLAAVNMGYMNREAGYRFEGDLDEVKLYGRALSAEEIRNRYAAVFDAYTELISFEAEYVINAVDLTWATASEYNNSYFAIERASADEVFTEIGKVDASGTTNVKSSYSFKDIQPLDGVNLYRLRIVKGDGLFTYSPIVRVEKFGPSGSMFLVYPNPVSGGEVNVDITNLDEGEKVVFQLSDMAGRKLLEQHLEVGLYGNLQFSLPVPEKLRSGIYHLTVITSKKSLSRKLMVVR
ncbi:hypothetical protein GCM10023188_32870 [Pontibacter saemangeumensis]|uniref:Laminin G domain-containing protein n=1 Tax=Pontibacter saemangeumensis TaxID=1084525 RepID=A0ABP8LWB9_9BACT